MALAVRAMFLNLFNTEQIIEVHETTGHPTNHGDPEPSLDQFQNTAISSLYYTPQADYNHDGLITQREVKADYMDMLSDYYHDVRNYLPGFKMRLGLGITF